MEICNSQYFNLVFGILSSCASSVRNFVHSTKLEVHSFHILFFVGHSWWSLSDYSWPCIHILIASFRTIFNFFHFLFFLRFNAHFFDWGILVIQHIHDSYSLIHKVHERLILYILINDMILSVSTVNIKEHDYAFIISFIWCLKRRIHFWVKLLNSSVFTCTLLNSIFLMNL